MEADMKYAYVIGVISSLMFSVPFIEASSSSPKNRAVITSPRQGSCPNDLESGASSAAPEASSSDHSLYAHLFPITHYLLQKYNIKEPHIYEDVTYGLSALHNVVHPSASTDTATAQSIALSQDLKSSVQIDELKEKIEKDGGHEFLLQAMAKGLVKKGIELTHLGQLKDRLTSRVTSLETAVEEKVKDLQKKAHLIKIGAIGGFAGGVAVSVLIAAYTPICQ